MFKLETATSKLIFINTLVYLVTLFVPDIIHTFFTLHTFDSPLFSPTQLITYQFVHSIHPSHLVFNMLLLYVFAQDIEEMYGAKSLIALYLISGIGAGILHNLTLDSFIILIYTIRNEDLVMAGASGSVWGILAVYAMSFPKHNFRVVLTDFRMSIRWFILFFFLVEAASAFIADYTDKTAHFAHLGGGLTGLFLYLFHNFKKKA